MVVECNLPSRYTNQLRSSEYDISSSSKVNMAVSNVYGTLPRAAPCHRRGNSDAGLSAKYATISGLTAKKSFLSGLKDKIKSTVEGKPKKEMSDIHERPQRLWTRGLESVYSSQRKFSSWRKASFRKNSSGCGFSSDSSAPSSPEFQRSILSKRARRSKCEANGFISASRQSLTSQISNEDSKKSNACKLLILGAEGVGKSALTVRFLTKRFIGEYAPEIESVYDQTMNLEGKDVNVQVWDSAIPQFDQNSSDDDTISQCSLSSEDSCLGNRLSSGSLDDVNTPPFLRKNKFRQSISKKFRQWRNSNESGFEEEQVASSETERRLKWADGIVVVYSICDQSSFEAACDVVHHVRKMEEANNVTPSTRTPILLVGNKLDLEHRRQVARNEARKTALNYSCTSCELSVSESFEIVSESIREHLISARKSSKARDAARKHKNRW